MLPPLQPLSTLNSSPPADLRHQAQLRRTALSSLFAELRSAPTLSEALAALREQAPTLVELGLHDEAARLSALTRAVLSDVARLSREAQQLEERSALPTQSTPDLSNASASK